MDQGLDLNATNDQGRTPLHAASQNGDIFTIKSLLRKGANVNQAVSIHLYCNSMPQTMKLSRTTLDADMTTFEMQEFDKAAFYFIVFRIITFMIYRKPLELLNSDL